MIKLILRIFAILTKKNLNTKAIMAKLRSYASKDPQIKELLSKWDKLSGIGSKVSSYSKLFNSANWLRYAKNLNAYEMREFERVIKEVERWTETKTSTRLDKDKNQQYQDTLKKETNGAGEWVSLSSSWLKAGLWKQSNRNKVMGTLTIEIKNYPKKYTYPVVPYFVWVNMKNASGSNGSGAGTIFWRYFLRSWITSNVRSKVLSDLRKKEISPKEAIDVFQSQVSKSAVNFYRVDTKKNTTGSLSRAWYNSYGGENYRKNVLKNYRQYYKQASMYTSYKNVKRSQTTTYTQTYWKKVKKEKITTNGYDYLKGMEKSFKKKLRKATNGTKKNK